MIMLSYEILMALRHLKSRKRSHAISLLTMISILGVMLGVWALIVVLAVLSGFGLDLKKKIIESSPHMIVERRSGDVHNASGLCKKINRAPGIKGCAPFILNEIMLTSRSGTSGVLLRGISKNTKRLDHLKKQMKSGKYAHLFAPSKIRIPPKPRFGWTLPDRREVVKDAKLTPEESKYLKLTPKLFEDKQKSASQPTTQNNPSKEEDFGLLTLKPKTQTRQLPGILLGKELAHGLGVDVGAVVRAVSPIGGSLTPMGVAPRIRKYRVAGVFFTGMYEYDTKFAFVTLKSAKKLFKMWDAVSGLELHVNNIHHTPYLKKGVRKEIGGGPFVVKDWIEMNRQLFGALQMEKIVMFVILTFIILVASFNIISTLFMVVVEKSQEIAILKSMGATRRSIMRIFMIEGVIIGVIGTILGLLLGWRTCIFLLQHPIKMNTDVYYIATLPVQMHLSDFISVAIASMLLSFLATIYPALQAADLNPVEGLQHE